MVALALATRGGGAIGARLRGIDRRRGDESLGHEVLVALELGERVGLLGLRLDQRRFRRAHVGLRAFRLRDDVAGVDARDHVARLDARAFGHAEPFEAAGRLRRDRRLALRDDVAGRVQHDELLRRKRRHDRRRGHVDDLGLQREPAARRGDDKQRHAPPKPAAAASRANRRELAVDPELGEIGGGFGRHEPNAARPCALCAESGVRTSILPGRLFRSCTGVESTRSAWIRRGRRSPCHPAQMST